MNGGVSGSPVFEFGPFRLDVGSRVLVRAGRIVSLPPKVIDTLVVLVENNGQLVEKEKLLRSIWPDTYVDDNSLMHNISVLRKVLGHSPEGPSYIETAPRRGYRFTATVRVAGEESSVNSESPRIRRLRWFPPLAAGLFGMILLPMAIWVELRSPTLPPVKMSPLTTYPGTEAFPTFSPDGRQVAFVWNGEKQDQFDIYVKSIGADPPRRLTWDAESECNLVWSPDGALIAFNHCRMGDTNPPPGTGLYIIPPSGGIKRKVGYMDEGSKDFGRPFTWTSDSKAVIKEEVRGASCKLVAMSVETGAEIHELTSWQPEIRDIDPCISPNGRTLAFVRYTGPGLGNLYLLRLDSKLAPHGQPERVTSENDFVANPLWNKNGTELLYTAGYQGERGLWRVSAHTGARGTQVPALERVGLQVALSRDGKLAYARRYRDFDIWRAELDETPAHPKPLIVSTFSDQEPHYSRDGRRIAFQSNRSGAMEIWVSNADGTGAAQLTFLHAQAGSLAWSPDGRQIAFDCRSGKTVDVYVVNRDDKKVRQLTTGPGFHITPAWSHDGKWIYFVSELKGRLEILKMRSSGGDPVQVTRAGGFFVYESVDGKSLFYAKDGGDPTTLWRKSLETGKEEQIIESLRFWSYFNVFDDGIYFAPARRKSKFDNLEVAFYDFATGHVRTIADIPQWPGIGFSVSPDRKSILFAPSVTRGADLMLIENFW